MNFKKLTEKAIDFILNLSVVAFGLGIFEKNTNGFLIGSIGVFLAIIMILRSKE